MSDPVLFILLTLAALRLAVLLAVEEGPFGLSARLRAFVDPRNQQDTWLRRGVNCPWCVGFWLSALVALALPGLWPLNWWAMAGAIVVLYRRD